VKCVIEHIGLAAADPARLAEWYLRVMEAAVVFDNGKEPPAFLLRLWNGFLLEIYPSDSQIEQTRHNGLAGWRHLAMRVESLEGARDWLTQRGVAFVGAIRPAGGGGQVLFFRDPEGNLWHLVERPAGSSLAAQAQPL